MAVRARPKRVTVPLDAAAEARLCGEAGDRMTGYASSGSDHANAAAASLAGLVHDFLESSQDGNDRDTIADAEGCDLGDTSGGEGGDEDRDRAAVETVRELMGRAKDKDRFRLRLAADVSTAVEGLAASRHGGGAASAAAFRRGVMTRLRAAGYNAGICKARWETSGGLTGGSYEYIDVVAAAAATRSGEEEGRRYIVDLEFAGEFAVARATERYEQVVAALPRVAVAREEAMRQVVRVVADAARRSLRARGLHVPPWRKSRYMLAKWLGPHCRTTCPMPASAGAIVTSSAAGEVRSRSVGFRAAAIKICS